MGRGHAARRRVSYLATRRRRRRTPAGRQAELRAKVCRGAFDVPLVQLKRPNKAKDLVKKMLVVDPPGEARHLRVTLSGAAGHDWLKVKRQ